jgi:uncharacterized repeat protein (TIGR03806 family)
MHIEDIFLMPIHHLESAPIIDAPSSPHCDRKNGPSPQAIGKWTDAPLGCRVRYLAACAICLTFAFCGCSAATPDSDDTLPESLSALHLFDGDLSRLVPARDVTRYQINSKSFCDYADSTYLMKVPHGATIRYTPDGPFEFPVGTVLAQTLSYSDADQNGARRIVETRVLLRRDDKWIGLPYVWNEAQTDAQLELIGASIEIRRRLPDGQARQQTHIVPNFNDCKRCHRIGDIVTPIAVSARQLNCPSTAAEGDAKGQLAAWRRSGVLQGLPSGKLPLLARWNDPASGTIDQRARAYLESNCAHCHNPRGAASNSGLQLASDVEKPSSIGVMKTPVAAGRGSGGLLFDILPGQPKASILLHRVRSVQAGVMMPEFGRTQVDEEGALLLTEWIASMTLATGPNGQAGLVGIVTDLTPAEVSHWVNAALAEGDARRGEEVFRRQELNCTKCHAIAGKGANVGPDLAKIDVTNKPEYIVESILLPDRSIKAEFRAVTLQTESGLVVTGIQIYDDGHDVMLRDPVRGDSRIAKTEIATRAEGGSLMPANVVAALKREDFLDLVRYLVELNSPGVGTRASQNSGSSKSENSGTSP